ncbi:MAG: hypothetical protein B6U77_00920 [Candidatus Hecatellales archaeon ex4484_218]|nr:MAG: hypothetical protein B6U77_00920 [Candidatus Hecatellales archaeon ex4484_218]
MLVRMLRQATKKFKQTLAKIGLKLIHKPRKPSLTKIKGKKFYLHPKVFNPKWTFSSIFLAENLEVGNENVVLDVGCGSGFQTVFAAEKASYVLALDLNPTAVRCTKINIELNGLKNKVDVLVGNLLSPSQVEKLIEDSNFKIIRKVNKKSMFETLTVYSAIKN